MTCATSTMLDFNYCRDASILLNKDIQKETRQESGKRKKKYFRQERISLSIIHYLLDKRRCIVDCSELAGVQGVLPIFQKAESSHCLLVLHQCHFLLFKTSFLLLIFGTHSFGNKIKRGTSCSFGILHGVKFSLED